MSSSVCKWIPFYSRLPVFYGILLDITKYDRENRAFQETLKKKKNHFKCKVFALLLGFEKSFIRFYQSESFIYLYLK